MKAQWNKDLITLVEPSFAGRPGLTLYSVEYVLDSVSQGKLMSLEGYRMGHSTSTTTTTSPSMSRKGRLGYTEKDDQAIARFVEANPQLKPSGNALWKAMEKAAVASGHRTWQSLKYRYQQSILPVVEALGTLPETTTTATTTNAASSPAPATLGSSPTRKSTSALRLAPVTRDQDTRLRKNLFASFGEAGAEQEDLGQEDEPPPLNNQETERNSGKPTTRSRKRKTKSRAAHKKRRIEEEAHPPTSELSSSTREEEIEHVLRRIQEETNCSMPVALHALVVASGDPCLALMYLQGRDMWQDPWTPEEDRALVDHDIQSKDLATRTEAELDSRRIFLGINEDSDA